MCYHIARVADGVQQRSHGDPDTNAQADGNGDANRHSHSNRYTHSSTGANCNTYEKTNSYCDGNAATYCDGNQDSDTEAYGYTNGDANQHPDTKAYGYADRHSHPGAGSCRSRGSSIQFTGTGRRCPEP